MKFKQFLESKNLSEEDYAKKSVEEMAQLQTEYSDQVAKEMNEKIDKASTKDELAKVQKDFNDYVEKMDGLQVKDTLAELTEKMAKIEEGGSGGSGVKKGSYVKFVEKNIEEKAADSKSYSAEMVIKVPELMTTANVTPNVADGYSPLFGNYVDGSVGHVPKADPFIMPLITVITQAGTENIYFSDRVNEEGDAEFIGEGDLKPLIDAEWTTTKKPIKEVALRWKFTKRLMMHAPSIVTDFRTHANELIENKIDDGLVNGDGLANNLEGIEGQAAAFIVPTQLANFYDQANIYDAINAMTTRVRLSNFKGAVTAVLNTVWKARMQGIKTTEGEYIVPPFVTKDGKEVAGTKVVFTNRFADTKIMVGDLKRFKAVIAENVMYDEGYENDDFSKNLVSRKLEAFMGTYIKLSDAGSIISDDIATVLTAIDKP